MLKIKNGKFIIKLSNSHEQLVQLVGIKTQVRIQCSLLFYWANVKLKCKPTAQTVNNNEPCSTSEQNKNQPAKYNCQKLNGRQLTSGTDDLKQRRFVCS